MIGQPQPEKSRLSTSHKRPSRTSTASYQQLERRNLLTTFVVNTSDDLVADDGLVSLREAISAANTNRPFSDVEAGSEDGDRIVFGPGARLVTHSLRDELQILDDLVIRGFEDPEGFKTSLQPRLGSRIFTIDTSEKVYFRDLEFLLGDADQGGLIKVDAGSDVTFKSAYLNNGSAEQGGAVYATDSRLVFDDTQFFNNNATEQGGGIWADGGEVIFLDQSRLSRNGSGEGGALFADNGTRVFAADTTFESNYSLDQGGGAIWAGAETTVESRNGIFESNGVSPDTTDPNVVDDIQGGAIAAFGDSLRVIDTKFSLNNAGRGGAVYSEAASSTFIESEFTQNSATVRGGAGSFSGEEGRITGGLVTGNSAAFGGGLAFASDPSNPAPFLGVVRNVEVAANTANSGAGISARGTDLRVIDSMVSNNIAFSRGGGIDLAFAKLFALETTFSTNTAEDFGAGGAIASFNSTSFIASSTFSENSAFSGAAVSLRNVEDMTLRETLFDSNFAEAGGAAVYVNGHSTLRSFSSTFESNESEGGGGAVIVTSAARFVSRSTSFVANTAFGEGGAILNYGTANISSTIFSENRAARGGAIKVGGENGLLSIQGATRFSANVAVANGSAISSTSSSITLVDNVEFNDNVVEDGEGDLLFIGDVTFHRVTNSTNG